MKKQNNISFYQIVLFIFLFLLGSMIIYIYEDSNQPNDTYQEDYSKCPDFAVGDCFDLHVVHQNYCTLNEITLHNYGFLRGEFTCKDSNMENFSDYLLDICEYKVERSYCK